MNRMPAPHNTAASSALRFLDVEHRYGAHPLLHRLSFHLEVGHILCLLGASGCGKTTVLRIAAGLERPVAGQVWLAGRCVSDRDQFVPPEQRGVGFLFQDYALFPHLTVADNVAFGVRHRSSTQQRQCVTEWLQRVGLADRGRHYPHQLSGGEQQRVALARALAPNPAVLLLDEPFSNLDTSRRQQMRAEVRHVLKAVGASALLVTHDPEEALWLGDQIALMAQGRILQQGTAKELYLSPQSPAAAAFFDAINRLDGQVIQQQVVTRWGTFAAPDWPEGSPVTVWIRPEGITLHPCGSCAVYDAATGEVSAVHFLGRTSVIEVRPSAEGKAANTANTLYVRDLGLSRWVVGQAVQLTFNPTLTFIFARAEGDGENQ